MAERKRVKGTKPKETMRQRQRRLLREQRAKAASNRVKQKALPPAGQSGGSKPPKGTKQPGTTRNQPQSRRSRVATQRAGASMGTRGSGVRTAGGAAPTYGQVARRQALKLARNALSIGKQFVKAGITGLAGRDDGSGSALMAAMAANDAINAARGSTAKERNKPQKQGPQPKQGPKPKKRNYKTAKEFAESNNPRYKPGNVKGSSGGSDKSKPKPKQRQNVTEKKPAKKAKPKKDNLTAVQRRAYSADSRNKQYDELRKAGKIKEASALAKKIAADAAAKRKKRA